MEMIAERDEKQIWFHALSRPYELSASFQGLEYVCILFVNDETINSEEQAQLSAQIISSGCRYAVCTGYRCSTWDDSIDMASLEVNNFEFKDETFVMTTWHENESVEDVIFYGLMNTMFDDLVFSKYLILTVGSQADLYEQIHKAIQSVWYGFDTA
jgi:hypothetical protein